MVETRKVQVTGGSTCTVSIPKDWATDNGVSAGSEVEFYPEGDSLFLTPRSEEEHVEGALNIATLGGDELTHAVMTMYVSGFDIIALESLRITTDQRRIAREVTQSLVGLGVLEETCDRVAIRDLLDSSGLSTHNAVTRIRLIALSMLENVIAAIVKQDDDVARDVIQRDDDVDRLWIVVSRVFRAILRTPKAAEEFGLPRKICFDYQSAARQLERIGDHATKIAHLSLNFEEPVDDGIVQTIQELFKDTENVVDGGMDALFAKESDETSRLANESREAVQAIDTSARGIDELLRDLDPARAQLLGFIVNSVPRSADYSGNIAETAFQKAASAP